MPSSFATSFGRSKARPSQGRSFNLVRWFLVLSFASIVVTSVASAFALSNFLKRNMLQRDAIVTMEFVNSIVRAEKVSDHLIASDPEVGNESIERLFAQIASVPEVIRANLYGQNRTILWSSDPEFIGAVFRTNRELDHAFGGEMEFEEGVVGEDKKAEHAFLEGQGNSFVENYLPIWGDDGKQVIGVAEVYKSADRLYGAIDRGTNLIWTNAVLGGILLYLVLAWIIHRASRVISEQQTQLVDSQALVAVGEMASAVAHGLRNPLASIRTSAELSLGDDPPASVKEALEDIVSQSDRLERWVRELLAFSRPETFDFEPVPVEGLLSDSLRTFEAQMRKRNVVLDRQVEADLPRIAANRIALGQVVNSLIANALEAMPEGGRLGVGAAYSNGGKMVSITIADSGEGIPEGQMGDVFQPFVTTKGTGLGVGLPLAKRIVERHGGSLELVLGPHGGTVAQIDIPVAG